MKLLNRILHRMYHKKGLYIIILISSDHSKISSYTPWPNKNASILFGIIFQELINKNEKLFHNNNK